MSRNKPIAPAEEGAPDPTLFRRTLIKVLTVQVVAVVLLYVLQEAFRP